MHGLSVHRYTSSSFRETLPRASALPIQCSTCLALVATPVTITFPSLAISRKQERHRQWFDVSWCFTLNAAGLSQHSHSYRS